MQLATEMDLPFLALTDPEFSRDPIPFVRAAQSQHPWLARSDYGFFVHGYQATRALNGRDDKLKPSMDDIVDVYGLGKAPWGRFMREQLMAYTNAKHDRIRNSVRRAFTPRAIGQHQALIARTIDRLLDEWLPKRRFDLAEFASHFPIAVLCGIMDTSTAEIPAIRDAMEAQVEMTTLNPAIAAKLEAAHDVLWNYCDRIIRDREAAGSTGIGVLDELIAVKEAGDIDEDELRYLLMILFPAGYDTSKNMLTFTISVLREHPRLWDRCAVDRKFCDAVLQEMFRFSSVGVVFRTVAEEIEYDGVLFPAGSRIVFGNSITGRDARAVAHPDVFDPERASDVRHLGFGLGAHICLGQFLALAQIAEGIHRITSRIHVPRLTGEVEWRSYLGVWGPSNLPLEVDLRKSLPSPTFGV